MYTETHAILYSENSYSSQGSNVDLLSLLIENLEQYIAPSGPSVLFFGSNRHHKTAVQQALIEITGRINLYKGVLDQSDIVKIVLCHVFNQSQIINKNGDLYSILANPKNGGVTPEQFKELCETMQLEIQQQQNNNFIINTTPII